MQALRNSTEGESKALEENFIVRPLNLVTGSVVS